MQTCATTGKENTYIVKYKTGDVTQRKHWKLRKHKRSDEGPKWWRPTFNQTIQLMIVLKISANLFWKYQLNLLLSVDNTCCEHVKWSMRSHEQYYMRNWKTISIEFLKLISTVLYNCKMNLTECDLSSEQLYFSWRKLTSKHYVMTTIDWIFWKL